MQATQTSAGVVVRTITRARTHFKWSIPFYALTAAIGSYLLSRHLLVHATSSVPGCVTNPSFPAIQCTYPTYLSWESHATPALIALFCLGLGALAISHYGLLREFWHTYVGVRLWVKYHINIVRMDEWMARFSAVAMWVAYIFLTVSVVCLFVVWIILPLGSSLSGINGY